MKERERHEGEYTEMQDGGRGKQKIRHKRNEERRKKAGQTERMERKE